MRSRGGRFDTASLACRTINRYADTLVADTKTFHDSVQNIKPLNDNLIQNRIQGFRFSSGNLTRKVPENIPYATFSSFFMMEKMNRAESRQSTMSTLHTIHNSMPPHR